MLKILKYIIVIQGIIPINRTRIDYADFCQVGEMEAFALVVDLMLIKFLVLVSRSVLKSRALSSDWNIISMQFS